MGQQVSRKMHAPCCAAPFIIILWFAEELVAAKRQQTQIARALFFQGRWLPAAPDPQVSSLWGRTELRPFPQSGFRGFLDSAHLQSIVSHRSVLNPLPGARPFNEPLFHALETCPALPSLSPSTILGLPMQARSAQ